MSIQLSVSIGLSYGLTPNKRQAITWAIVVQDAWHHVASGPTWVNILRPRQNGHHFADDTFERIVLNENVRITITISLKVVLTVPINNIPALVQIMAWCRPGDKPLSELMMVRLPTHICVTRPQWVKGEPVRCICCILFCTGNHLSCRFVTERITECRSKIIILASNYPITSNNLVDRTNYGCDCVFVALDTRAFYMMVIVSILCHVDVYIINE